MPVSTLMCTRSVPPQAEAAALYSRALTSQETAWVILRAISWGTISGGVWPRIKTGA